MSSIRDAESGQRGFLLTGDPQYLDSYNAAIQALPSQTSRLRTSAADEPAMRARVDTLNRIISEKISELQETVAILNNRVNGLGVSGAQPAELFTRAIDQAMEGESLVPELRGASPPARDVVLDLPRTTNSDRRRALIRGDYKLVAIGDDDAFQLFDLRNDPGEDHDVQWTARAKLDEMKAAYRALSAKMPSVCPSSREKLRGKKSHRPC